MPQELFNKPVTELSGMLARGEVSAVELMRSVAERTRKVEPKVRAFNSMDEEDALAQAAAGRS